MPHLRDAARKFFKEARERLTLWAAQMGWMHSIPERKNKEDRRTRWEQYGEGHPYTHLPDIEGWEWLASAFCEVGMASAGPSGHIPLTWQELKAWHQITGRVYSSWELGVIRQMSENYVKWQHLGGQQKDLATEVPYIVKTPEALAKAGEAIMRNRDKSAARREG